MSTSVDPGDNLGMTTRRLLPPYRDRVTAVVRAPRPLDVALAVAITATGIAEIWVPFSSVQGEGSRVTASVVTLLMGLPLAFRRTHPLPVVLCVVLVWPLVYSVTPTLVLFFGQFVPLAVAVFSVARYGRGREPWYGAMAGAAALLFVDLRVPELQAPGEIVFHWGVFTLVWLSGWTLRRTADRAAEALQRAVEVEVAATERTMTAILEERTRIARELHDVVAHAVSVMVVQAGAAEQVVDDDPAFVRQALQSVRTTGSEALAEMRRVVEILRDPDEVGALEPQPGMAARPRLVKGAQAAGLSVDLEVAGRQRALPTGVDVAAFRVVQESLTNVRRHAAASHVAVRLCYSENELSIEVADDGAGAERAAGAGHGLLGMRERVMLYGGRVETQSAKGHGFTVRAVLPLGPA